MRESFAAASGGDAGDAPSSSRAQADLSLKPGTTLTINFGGKVHRNPDDLISLNNSLGLYEKHAWLVQASGPSRFNQAQSTAVLEPPSTSGAGVLPKLPPPPGSEQAGELSDFKFKPSKLTEAGL